MDISFDLRSLIITVGVLIAAVSLAWNVTLYVRQRRRRILVTYSIEKGFSYKDNKDSDQIHVVPHRVVVTVKNAGTHGCFVELPMTRLPKKVNGERYWVQLEGGEEIITPELKPGESLEKQYELDMFLKGPVLKLKDRHNLRFVIKDSIGNCYKSDKLRLKTIRKFAKRELEKLY